jgi:hypothetical protein
MITKELSKPWEFPSGILGQIKENAVGGYVLFTIGENGTPTTFCEFEDDISTLAILKHMEFWQAAMNAALIRGCINGGEEKE